MKDFSFELEKDFETQMETVSRQQNMVCAVFFFLYIFVASGIFVQMSKKEFLFFALYSFSVAVIAQFGISPHTNRILTREISSALKKNDDGLLSSAERTEIVKKLLLCPKKISTKVSFTFLIAGALPIISVILKFKITGSALFYFLFASCVGIFNSFIQSFSYAERLCSRNITRLLSQGVDVKIINRENLCGPTLKFRVLIFCIVPVVFLIFMQIFFAKMIFDGFAENAFVLRRLSFTSVFNALIFIATGAYLQQQIFSATKNIIKILENLTLKKQMNTFLPSDLSNDFSYNIFLVDELISFLHEISFDAASSGESILSALSELSALAKKTEEISVTESASVQKCIDVMESEKIQHEKILTHIGKLQQSAFKAKRNSILVSELISSGVQKMSEIIQSNLDSIYGIKKLGEKIDKLWDVLNSINIIAEKTKNIAFNSELEVTVAGEKGKKIHVVSNEILRLAESIKNSTAEIKTKVSLVQHDCDNLIISNEAETQRRRDENDFYTKLERNFKELYLSCDVMAESLKKIFEVLEDQQESFENETVALHEINSGFEKFSLSSKKIGEEISELNKVSANRGFVTADEK
jgi:methyl-accepting chemotaxis protein